MPVVTAPMTVRPSAILRTVLLKKTSGPAAPAISIAAETVKIVPTTLSALPIIQPKSFVATSQQAIA